MRKNFVESRTKVITSSSSPSTPRLLCQPCLTLQHIWDHFDHLTWHVNEDARLFHSILITCASLKPWVQLSPLVSATFNISSHAKQGFAGSNMCRSNRKHNSVNKIQRPDSLRHNVLLTLIKWLLIHELSLQLLVMHTWTNKAIPRESGEYVPTTLNHRLLYEAGVYLKSRFPQLQMCHENIWFNQKCMKCPHNEKNVKEDWPLKRR